jgi:hypothetical protein
MLDCEICSLKIRVSVVRFRPWATRGAFLPLIEGTGQVSGAAQRQARQGLKIRGRRRAQQTATEWLWRYNAERSNMAPGGMTPYQKMANAA